MSDTLALISYTSSSLISFFLSEDKLITSHQLFRNTSSPLYTNTMPLSRKCQTGLDPAVYLYQCSTMEKRYINPIGSHKQGERYSKAATLEQSENVKQPNGSSPLAVNFELKLFVFLYNRTQVRVLR